MILGKTSYCLPKEMGDGVLTGNMLTSGKDRLKKVVPNDDTDIWTLSPGIRMPPILQGSNKREMEDRGSLDGENDLFRQRLQAKHVPNDDTLCRPSLGEGSTNRWGM